MSDEVGSGQTLLGQAGVILTALSTFALGIFATRRQGKSSDEEAKVKSRLTDHQIMRDIIETLRTQLEAEQDQVKSLSKSLDRKDEKLASTQQKMRELQAVHARCGETIAALKAAAEARD